ncbi:hypothetical protein [Undibacterium sp.]|uniref:hypothetical protein n=1 Tax=Undibacterium sp. TaxID=1914977 RepID=UPI00374DC58E
MYLKYLAYAFLLGLYAAFAWAGKAPVEGFLVVLTGVISALGASHAMGSASRDATDAANHANPVPPPKVAAAPTIVSTN